jgi:hypothetical protein
MEAETAKAPTEQGHRQGSTAAQFEHGELSGCQWGFLFSNGTKQQNKKKSHRVLV